MGVLSLKGRDVLSLADFTLEEIELIFSHHLFGSRRVWCGKDEKFRTLQHFVKLSRRVELIHVKRCGFDSFCLLLDTDGMHSQGACRTSYLPADGAYPDNAQGAPGEVGRRVTFPMLARLLVLNVQELLAAHQHRHQTKFGQRLSVNTSGGGEERLGQAPVIAASLDELADARARRLDP